MEIGGQKAADSRCFAAHEQARFLARLSLPLMCMHVACNGRRSLFSKHIKVKLFDRSGKVGKQLMPRASFGHVWHGSELA